MKSIAPSILLGAFALAASFAPAKEKNIVETAVEAGQFKTLAAALGAADLVGALQGNGPFTVFAPTDEAFAKLPKDTVEDLLKPENKDALTDILTYHVVSGKVPFKTAVGLENAKALNKKTLQISVKEGRLVINDSKVIANDIGASNGVIHVIDTVLLPPKKTAAVPAEQKGLQIAQMAIQKGVPLFNHGNPEACAAIYEEAVRTIAAMPGCGIDCGTRKMMQVAMAKASQSHCASTKSWALRHALDAYSKSVAQR